MQEVTKDYVLDEINRLKNECQTDEAELQRIKETKDRLSHIADAEIKLNEFCQRVRQNLDNATIQDKRLALEALDIRVTASTQGIDIKGIIPVEFPTLPSSTDVTTIAQTSGCLSSHAYSYSIPFSFSIQWKSPLHEHRDVWFLACTIGRVGMKLLV